MIRIRITPRPRSRYGRVQADPPKNLTVFPLLDPLLGILRTRPPPFVVMSCEYCGADFEVTNRPKRFCSERCRKKAERKRYKEKKLHAVQKRRYEETGLLPNEKLCKVCGAKFDFKHNGEAYCSDTCRRIGYEESKLAGRAAARERYYANKRLYELECEWCKSSFESESKVKYCSNQCRSASTAHRVRLNTYGLSQVQYEGLIERSGGLCEICQEKEAQHIDHCHQTGSVRGLLCQQCNHGLGNFGDSINSLHKAIEYLKR